MPPAPAASCCACSSPLPSVCCRVRSLGGGGDGGSTGAESRSSYLEMYAAAKPDSVDPALVANLHTSVAFALRFVFAAAGLGAVALAR